MASIPFCDPCQRGTISSEASSWCSDCAEALCKTCDNAHRINKLSLSHTILKIEDMPPESTSVLTSKLACPQHSSLNLEMYCGYHDAVCCRSCMTEKHRGCDQLQPLNDASNDVKSVSITKAVKEGIEKDIQLLEHFKQGRAQNAESLQIQVENIKTSIAQTKQRIIDRLESLEHSLLSELAALNLKNESKLEAQNESIETFMKTSIERKRELDFALEYGSDSQIFITVHKLKHSSKDNSREIRSFGQSLLNFNILYNEHRNPEVNLNSLGTLSTKQEVAAIIKTKQRKPSKAESGMFPQIENRSLSQRKQATRKSSQLIHDNFKPGRLSRNSNISARTTHSSVDGCKMS